MADQEYVAGLQFETNSDDIDKAAESSEKLDENVTKAGDSAQSSEKKFAILAAKLVFLKKVVLDSAQAYVEFDAKQGQLANANTRAAATTEQLSEQVEVQNELFSKYGVKVADSTDLLTKLTDASEDAGKAAFDLALANDIAAQSEFDLAGATDFLAKIRAGNTEGLETLRGLTKKQVEDLGRIQDESLKSATAIKILTEAYAGAAAENAGLADEQASFFATLDRGLLLIGEAVVGFADIYLQFFGLRDATEDAEGGVVGLMDSFDEWLDSAKMVGTAIVDIRKSLTDLSIFEKGPGQVLVDAQRARNKAAAEGVRLQEKQKEAAIERAGAELALEQTLARARAKRAREDAEYLEENKDFFEAINATEDEIKKFNQDRAAAAKKAADEAERELEAKERLEEKEAAEAERELKEQQALDRREQLAQLELQGNEYGAERLRILDAELTTSEKLLALRDSDDKREQKRAADVEKRAKKILAQKKKEADLRRKNAERDKALEEQRLTISRGLVGNILNAAGAQEAAGKAQAAFDGATYAYKAVASAAAFNWWSAAEYAGASIAAFALAGRSGGGGASSSVSESRSRAEEDAAVSASADAGAPARSTFAAGAGGTNSVSLVLNYSSQFPATPQQAREFGDTISEDLNTVI